MNENIAKVKTPYQICTRCILSTEDDPDIYFDSYGVCNHCHLYEEEAARRLFKNEDGQKKLARLVDEIKQKGKGKEYDCVIGVSGGADSTYVAYLVKEILGLRPLAVHCDNGWNSELAVSNIANVLKKLDIDLVTHVINWEEFRDLQLAYLKASVIDVEATSDHAIFASLYEAAHKYKVKYILSGENFLTEGILPASWIHNKNDLVNINAIYRRFGKNKRLKTFPKLGYLRKTWYEEAEGIQYVRILDYVSYIKSDAKKLIGDKLGWRDYGGKHYESIITRFYQSYILPKKFHVDKRRSHLSTLICSGQITREEALAEAAIAPYENTKIEEDKEYVIKKFGLTPEEFQQIMALPAVPHTAYPSIVNSINRLRPFIKGIRKVRDMFIPSRRKPAPKLPAKGRRVAMLVDNAFVKDKRVMQEAMTVAENFDLTVYGVYEEGLPIKEIRDGIKIHRIFPENIFKVQSIRTIKHMARRIGKEGYDVLHCHDHLMLHIGSLVKKARPETILIYDSHELFHSWPINYSSISLIIRAKSYLVRKYQVYLEKRAAKYIDYLITVNNSLANILKPYLEMETEPVVIRNLPPYEEINGKSDMLRHTFNIPANDKILVYIGMHVYPKTLNIEAVIDQVGNKSGLSFILICRADIYRKAVEDYAAGKGYSNIYFHDLINPDDISLYLAGCDAGVVPTWNKKDLSYWYALDNKLFNYLMAEIPILATAQPEYKAIVEPHNIGVCVNPDEANAYYNGLQWIFQHYDELKQNLRKAKVDLNWKKESQPLTHLYDTLVVRSQESEEAKKQNFIKPRVTMLLDNPFTADKRVYREATALAQAGYNLTLLAVADGIAPREEIIDGVRVRRIFDKRIFDIKKQGNLRRIARRLSREKIDVLHCHDWLMMYIGYLVKKINPEVVLIYDSHELFYSWPINYSNRNSWWIRFKSNTVRQIEVVREKRSARMIDQLITVNTSFGEKMKAHFGFTKEPVIVKNIAEAEEITDRSDIIRKEFNIPSTTKIIVNFSLYIYQKSRNLEVVINQFANVDGVALVMISKDGGNKKEIMQMVKDKGIKNVYFHEAIFGKDVVNVLGSCDMGLVSTWNKQHLSYWLGLENKLFSYVQAEIPILATAQPEHLQVIEQHNIGVCVNADEPDAYLKGYYELVERYNEFKKNVIETKKILHWDNEKDKLTELYKNIARELNGTK